MKRCLELLAENNLMPKDADKASLQSRKGDEPLLKLRASGLDRLLTNRELSQVLYSLCGRRRYIPHGGGSLEETDDAQRKFGNCYATKKLENEYTSNINKYRGACITG